MIYGVYTLRLRYIISKKRKQKLQINVSWSQTIVREDKIMNYHFSPDYDTDKKMREQEIKRSIDRHYWIEQAQSRQQPRRKSRWRTFITMLSGFFF